jgi:hypothetical protein
MNINAEILEKLLLLSAVGQLIVAALNLRLEKILGWEPVIIALPDLVREVFVVHKWFISVTLVIFATLTIRFASELAGPGHEIARWLAAGIALFWGIRTAIQWFSYGADHWRGKPRETIVHWFLTLVYSGWTTVYLLAAFR